MLFLRTWNLWFRCLEQEDLLDSKPFPFRFVNITHLKWIVTEISHFQQRAQIQMIENDQNMSFRDRYFKIKVPFPWKITNTNKYCSKSWILCRLRFVLSFPLLLLLLRINLFNLLHYRLLSLFISSSGCVRNKAIFKNSNWSETFNSREDVKTVHFP